MGAPTALVIWIILSHQPTLVATMKDLTDRALVGWPILLILLFFNMLVCAYSGRVGWLLFWAIAFSSCAQEHGYEYGKTEERPRRIGGSRKV
jgi:hypothetical protein